MRDAWAGFRPSELFLQHYRFESVACNKYGSEQEFDERAVNA